ncbi:MAG TPA: baseplate J/gp47 family protein, partial [Chloroflexota bacterium]|nr:baseplate J/gp47 family protein [Chloroflexota bacterium]
IRFNRYRSGGGAIGNVGRGTLVVPKSSSDLSYVKWVINLRPATGGRDRETIDAFKLRGPKLVRTREVAVTRSDFEFLAREASPQAARVRCLAASTRTESNGSGLNFVRLLLVPAVPTSDEYVPREQLLLTDEVRRDLCRRVRSYLEERCPLTTELAVSLPDYRWVNVRAKLVTRARKGLEASYRHEERLRIQDEARRALYKYLHPVTGGTDGSGWPFGKSLTLGDVYPLLQMVDGVEYVEEVRFRDVTFDAYGNKTVGSDERLVKLTDTEVLCSDVHEIEVIEE